MDNTVSDERPIEQLAHRTCSRYVHDKEPGCREYVFQRHTLEDFARALLALKAEQPAALSDQYAALINQAHDMLLAYADDQRGKGNDCAAMGAECSADAVLRLGAAASAVDEQPAAQVPEGWQLVPEYRGYAHLGIGMYNINHSRAGEDPELVISIATEAEKAGRKVGEERDNEPGGLIQPEQMAVRLRFENVAGLNALESQLRYVREVHFSASPKPPEPPAQADWQHLQKYGYAPGNYQSRCLTCEQIVSGLDKRAVRCKPCAEQLDSAQAVEQAPTQPTEPKG